MFELIQYNTPWVAITLLVAAVGVVLYVWLTSDREPIPVRSRVPSIEQPLP